jgi:ABC-type nitrate/sulfonate/bicarbonate transport system substrate-binding protein
MVKAFLAATAKGYADAAADPAGAAKILFDQVGAGWRCIKMGPGGAAS